MESYYFPYQLAFKYPFKLSHTSRTHTQNVYLLLEEEGIKAWGETVFIPYYPETLNSFQDLIAKIDLLTPNNLEEIQSFIQDLIHNFPEHSFAIAGIDTALHNFLAFKENKSIADLYDISGLVAPSSFTLGISDEELMQQKILENPDVAYFKLKVNEEEIDRIIDTYTAICDKPFVVDANQGFTNKDKALHWCEQLHNMGVPYIEQPFDKQDFESTLWLKERCPIPIIADESFQDIKDLDTVAQTFDGINIKLMKCGGVAQAYNIFQEAKKLHLKTVLGCMSESSVGVSAAYHLAPLANWVDLDGPLLISNDLFSDEADLTDAERIEILKRGQE